MTLDELKKQIWEILPIADFEEDNDGQIVIYTNMKEIGDGDGQLGDLDT